MLSALGWPWSVSETRTYQRAGGRLRSCSLFSARGPPRRLTEAVTIRGCPRGQARGLVPEGPKPSFSNGLATCLRWKTHPILSGLARKADCLPSPGPKALEWRKEKRREGQTPRVDVKSGSFQRGPSGQPALDLTVF